MAAARERVDTTGLPASLLEALAVTDSLRIAVTPAIAADAGTITALHATIDADHETIVQLRGTIALDTAIIARHVAALAARESELQLERQKHAPRCSAKCGAALGIGAVVLVRAGLKLVLEAIR